MLNSIHKKVLLVALTALIPFGCSAEKQSEVKEISTSDLPIIKVDNDHSQVRTKDDKSKHLVYELKGPVKEICLDTSSFDFNEYNVPKQNDTAHKAIQVMHSPASTERKDFLKDMKVYTMPFDEKNTNQKIELVNTVGANNILVIAIGWEATVEGKIDLKPIWLGSIRIN